MAAWLQCNSDVMPTDRFQTQRFELKYLVNEETARAVRQFVACYLKPDEFAATLPDNAITRCNPVATATGCDAKAE